MSSFAPAHELKWCAGGVCSRKDPDPDAYDFVSTSKFRPFVQPFGLVPPPPSERTLAVRANPELQNQAVDPLDYF